jgi:protein-S-isoprenylcysteine O-methyltransferase Ste14
MSNLLIACASALLSVLLWGLLTRRWSAKARRSRQQSRDNIEGPLLLRIPVPWVFVLAYLLGVALNLFLPIHVPPPEALKIAWRAGIAFVVVGSLVAFPALYLFRKSSTTTVPFETPAQFVTSGPFRISRNPMYVGLALIYLGVSGTQGQVWPLLLLPIVLVYLDRVVIPVEERHLLQVFGEAYGQYRGRVRRWL